MYKKKQVRIGFFMSGWGFLKYLKSSRVASLDLVFGMYVWTMILSRVVLPMICST